MGGTVKAEPVSSYFRTNLSIYQEKRPQETKIPWCMERLSFSKTNIKEVSGEPETQRFVQ